MCLISVEFKGWDTGGNVKANKKIKAEFDNYMVAEKNVGAHLFFFYAFITESLPDTQRTTGTKVQEKVRNILYKENHLKSDIQVLRLVGNPSMSQVIGFGLICFQKVWGA